MEKKWKYRRYLELVCKKTGMKLKRFCITGWDSLKIFDLSLLWKKNNPNSHTQIRKTKEELTTFEFKNKNEL